MFRVSYINTSSNTIAHKGGFNTIETAKDWIKSQATNIKPLKPLKLLVWDKEIDCYSTVEEFNNDRNNATATDFLKTLFI